MSDTATDMRDAAKTQADERKGTKIIKFYGPGNLYPGAGKAARKSEKDVFCGSMTGLAMAYREQPNSKDPTKVSVAFSGSFVCITHTGEVITPAELYLPSILEGTARAVLKSGNAQAFRFAIDVWAIPDEVSGRVTAQGYQYEVRDRGAQNTINPALEIAYESGLLVRPKAQLAGPAEGGETSDEIDPETGEVLPQSEDAQTEPVKAARSRK